MKLYGFCASKKSFIILCMAIIFLSCSTTSTPVKTEKSLYHRLGGYDAIAAVVDDFMAGMGNDPQLKRFFVGMSPEDGQRTRQLIVDFMCKAAGGPCYYTGRTMKETHEGMGINDSDWNLAAGLVASTLDKFKVPPKEKGEVLGLVSSLKGDMVEN